MDGVYKVIHAQTAADCADDIFRGYVVIHVILNDKKVYHFE